MGRADWGRKPTTREGEIREILSAGERDGLNVRQTAERAGMPPGTLSWWRGDLRRRDRLRRAPAASSPARRSPPSSFVEVVVTPGAIDAPASGAAPATPDAAPFEIEVRGGRRVRVPESFGLTRLVRELEGC